MNQYLLHKAKVQFSRPLLSDLTGTLERQLTAELFPNKRKVAIAVGSRGIHNIAEIVKTTVTRLKTFGISPFIVPAMGSHGGATADGQRLLLSSYRITESEMGCPILSSMEVVELDPGGLSHPLYMDRNAFEADGVVLINRIKPHTDFHGTYESGLAKMAVIGLGKERQASILHEYGVHGLRDLMPKAAARILALGKIVAGMAIIENAYDETAHLEVIPAGRILSREPALLEEARKNMPRLPLDEIDVLIVDELGKNISGSGMDTNIIGRIRIPGELEPEKPRVRSLLVNDLTAESHGNATGMGLADVITQKFFHKIDFPITYKNIITSSFLERGKLPVISQTARDGFAIALRSCGFLPLNSERIIRIRNTLALSEIYISKAVIKALSGRKDVTIFDEPVELFDAAGELNPF
jgi:hypothetical protein